MQRSTLRRNRRGGTAPPAGPPLDEAAAVESIRRLAMVGHGHVPQSRHQLNRALLAAIPTSTRFVLIGEASHGTQEFYEQRAELTQLLVSERGFTGVLVESDWPDAFRVNRYVRGLATRDGDGRQAGRSDDSALEALSDYKRFPRWMWHNRSVESFVEWLRNHNLKHVRPGADSATDPVAAARRCGFYGMDVYSLHGSAEAVLG
ncbi:hypothetical protein PLESTF_001673000 [Pleodorina starrii]|nr:hypothetical protein PLESTM_001545700 [Pleodorina starrii]GLC75678.1 hypothetical protein PLESTF_001673000 [Pleodorina starrii]